jgi:hypothetical protein
MVVRFREEGIVGTLKELRDNHQDSSKEMLTLNLNPLKRQKWLKKKRNHLVKKVKFREYSKSRLKRKKQLLWLPKLPNS